LKFGNVVLAVALMEVISVLIDFVLFAVLISPLGSRWGLNVSSIVAGLVASLLAGYVFALRIQEESRIRSVAEITVLGGFVQAFAVMIVFPTNPYYAAWTKETLQSMFQTGSWTTMDWFAYEELALTEMLVLNVVLALVLGFVGLYAGSLLRKPKKS
jgi:hypothetical protein